MALDGIYLRFLKKEFSEKLLFSKVDKIYQPSKEEVVISLRGKSATNKLLLNCSAESGRAVITEESFSNPQSPPMFTMLLRKHLSGGTLSDIRQSGMDRALYFDFSTINSFGDRETVTLVLELAGRSGNIILVSESGRILDALRRTDLSQENIRTILSGAVYEPLPKRGGLDISEVSENEIISKIFSFYKEERIISALLKATEGLSPSSAETLLDLAGINPDKALLEITENEEEMLKKEIFSLKKRISEKNSGLFFTYFNKNTPVSFSFLEKEGDKKGTDSPSAAAESYYKNRAARLRAEGYSSEIGKLVSTRLQRVIRKIGYQTEDLKKSRDREKYKKYGELLTANLYRLESGKSEAVVFDYYENEDIKIPLDKRLSPSANANRYYKEYNKRVNAEKALLEQLASAEEEKEYLSSVLDSIKRIETETEAREIREELTLAGYIRERDKKKKTSPKTEFKKAQSQDGFSILIGKNNLQNDRLTFKTAEKTDIWLHVKNIPGSHVLIKSEGREITEKAIFEAAVLAAENSSAKGGKVAVDYTFKKFVKKPPAAAAGRVIYTDYKTIYVDIEEQK